MIFISSLTILAGYKLNNTHRFHEPMQHERVTNDIYVFTSDLYAQVTATAIVTSEGAVLVDTLLYPDETRQIKRFIEVRLHIPIRYLVNSHYHADHTTGTSLFPNVQVIAHKRCRELLDTKGRASLQRTQSLTNDMDAIELILPHIVFDGEMTLKLGNKTLHFWSTPGHSLDGIVCAVEEDNVLIAADTIMPIPYFVGGDIDLFRASLQALLSTSYDSIVQGHGEVILKGEVGEKIQGDIDYLDRLSEAVERAIRYPDWEKRLKAIDVETCGKSRILLNGLVEQLHQQNVAALADIRRKAIQLEAE